MKKFDVVVFDLDSTLVSIEGLDWLAETKGKGREVSLLTKLSMEGKISVNEAFGKKMAMISPSKNDLISLGEKYCSSLVDDAREVISVLHKLGKEIWIVTGNFDPAVKILAHDLNIPEDKIVCNEVYFDQERNYSGFDSAGPLANNGGKSKVINERIKKLGRVVFIGDAVTDLEAKDVVDMFVGFGGVEQRAIVKQNSEFYIDSKSMLPLLKMILTPKEYELISDTLIE